VDQGPDPFVRFVDAVAETLDEPETGSAQLAARIHLSRSQADRVIKATAGESTTEFRRRILLERAAYHVVCDESRLLDIAVAAGFSSHEAFTRAFQRAYGVAPSVWRRQPGQLELNSASGVHFHPPSGLRLPADRTVTSMDLIVELTEHHVWLLGELIDRAERIPDELLDRLIEISVEGIDRDPTLRSLLARLVGQLAQWNASVANVPYDFAAESGASLDEMRATLAEAGPVFVGHVRDVAERGALDETFVDATEGGPWFYTYGGMIAHVLTYAAHRRTLVVGALASAGITDLEDDPLTWEPVRPAGPTTP
jgi:AraC-like DNA-binding protein